MCLTVTRTGAAAGPPDRPPSPAGRIAAANDNCVPALARLRPRLVGLDRRHGVLGRADGILKHNRQSFRLIMASTMAIIQV